MFAIDIQIFFFFFKNKQHCTLVTNYFTYPPCLPGVSKGYQDNAWSKGAVQEHFKKICSCLEANQ